ncbi:nicotinate phosphoribosyltransferase [Clostridia bacterium]|nr:nicotinate phosphoribosyltransferase [Clostridia bacterium]
MIWNVENKVTGASGVRQLNYWVIESLLDTDLYKYTMLLVYFEKHVNDVATFEFKCRNDIVYTEEMTAEINRQLDYLCELHISEAEISFLRAMDFMGGDGKNRGFFEFLRMYRLRRECVKVELIEGGKLSVISEGPIFFASMFETFVLSIVGEVYYRFTLSEEQYLEALDAGERKLYDKIARLKDEIARGRLVGDKPFKLSDMGARRRFSFEFHKFVAETLNAEFSGERLLFTGTSDIHLARLVGVKAIGTMAHEFLCTGQGLDRVPVMRSQKHMLEEWLEVFRSQLGIALSDNLGFKKFMRDCDRLLAMAFSGFRHDSGDPFAWGEQLIAWLESMSIDPLTKDAIFSDSLNFDKAVEIFNYFIEKINAGFGIGTYLTCDMSGGVTALQNVMKVVEVNYRPVAKLSDDNGKTMCRDKRYVDYMYEQMADEEKRVRRQSDEHTLRIR